MAKEIERKYLIKDDSWKKFGEGIIYRQGYLSSAKERVVRVRTVGNKGFLTIKGISVGLTRAEYEYEIPVNEADEMLTNLCEKPIIEKKRYKIEYKGLIWEIDEFLGENYGLKIAEVELLDENQEIQKPEWAGEEVTGDVRYFNSNLVTNPYTKWKCH